jgi:hypothetical protein
MTQDTKNIINSFIANLQVLIGELGHKLLCVSKISEYSSDAFQYLLDVQYTVDYFSSTEIESLSDQDVLQKIDFFKSKYRIDSLPYIFYPKRLTVIEDSIDLTSLDSKYVKRIGDTMSGPLVVFSTITHDDGTLANHSATLGQLNSSISNLSSAYYPLNSNPAGYLTTEIDPVFTQWLNTNPLEGFATESWTNTNFYNKTQSDNRYYPLSSNPAGYLTSFTETDPTVPNHVKTITTTQISNWNAAYGWGNHALAGYATTSQLHNPVTLGTNQNGLSLSTQVLSLDLASNTTNGALSSTDWSTFNSKQPQLNGTGFVKISGTTISYDNNSYYLASNPNGYTSNLGTVTSVTASSPLFSSGGATPNLTIQQANGSQSGFLSSANWTTFNNKISGSGTTNYLAKFTAAGTVGDSAIFESGGNVGIGTDSPTGKLSIRETGISGVAFDFVKLLTASGGNLNIQCSDLSSSVPSWKFQTGNLEPIIFSQSANDRMSIFSDGNVGINTDTDAGFRLDVNGTARATAFFTSSDKRKKDIISQDGDLAIYRFKGNDQIHYGYIAQDMQALYPHQVSKGTDGMMSLNYVEILVKKVHDLESKLKRHGLD